MPNQQYKNLIEHGRRLMTQGHLDEAVVRFHEASKINPMGCFAYVCLGTIYFRRSMYMEAIDYFTRAIQLRPRIVDIRYLRGLSYGRNGDYELAEEDFRSVLKVKPHVRAARGLEAAETNRLLTARKSEK